MSAIWSHRERPARVGELSSSSDGGLIARWTAHLAGESQTAIGEELPAHSPGCAGCGPSNPSGLHLRATRTTSGVKAVHSFTEAQVGAPGIAHGGAVALAFDDLFGFALYAVGSLAVTRSLTVEYRSPFWLHRSYTFYAQVTQREGRRLLLHAEAWDATGQAAGLADAVFVAVGPEHFVREAEN